jgi:hypothetical protein
MTCNWRKNDAGSKRPVLTLRKTEMPRLSFVPNYATHNSREIENVPYHEQLLAWSLSGSNCLLANLNFTIARFWLQPLNVKAPVKQAGTHTHLHLEARTHTHAPGSALLCLLLACQPCPQLCSILHSTGAPCCQVNWRLLLLLLLLLGR